MQLGFFLDHLRTNRESCSQCSQLAPTSHLFHPVLLSKLDQDDDPAQNSSFFKFFPQGERSQVCFQLAPARLN